jgi:PST family polysaccharide transporter
MSILRAGVYSAAAAGARLVAGLLVVKLVALFAGPEGVGKMGQFMSVMSLLAVLAGGGIASGVTKYVAEYRDSPERLQSLVTSGLSFSLATSVVAGAVSVTFAEQLAVWLLGDASYRSLIWVLAVAQSMIALHNYLVAIINGFMDVRRVALIHVVGATVSVVITALLSWRYQLYGALLALVVGQGALVFVSAALAWRSGYLRPEFLRLSRDSEMIGKLLRFSAMTLTSALLPPVVHIWVRNHLAERFSWEQVGYWQAVSKISEAYLLCITMAISMYYLPKLSSIQVATAFRAELRSAYRIILPVVVAMAIVLYVLREWVLLLLFTPEFTSASHLFLPQLVGDVIKIAAFLQSYIMIAKALTRAFLFSEVLFSLTYVALVYLLVDPYGLIGAMYAFTINYAFYWLYTFLVARWYVRQMD